MRNIAAVLALTAAGLCAQEIQFPPSFDSLAKKAKEVVNVTISPGLIGLAEQFLSDRDRDELLAKQLIRNLKGIYIRSYEFDRDGEYSEADLDAIRRQLKQPEWTSILEVRERRESAQVFVKSQNGNYAGLTILAAEPRELTIVHILGDIRPEDLTKLGGQLGIPKIEFKP